MTLREKGSRAVNTESARPGRWPFRVGNREQLAQALVFGFQLGWAGTGPVPWSAWHAQARRFPAAANAASRVVSAVAHAWRSGPSLALTGPVAAMLDRLPVSLMTAIFGGMLKGVDAVVTNVPGLPSRCYLAAEVVPRVGVVAPPSGAALSVALLSHVGIGCVGLHPSTPASCPIPTC